MALPRRQHVVLIFFLLDYCTSKVTSELRNPTYLASAVFTGEFEFYSEEIIRIQISRIKLQEYLKKNVYRLCGENNKL